MEVKPGYKQTAVGLIPAEWELSPLGDCGAVVMGQSPPGASYNRTGIGSALINGPTEFTERYPIRIQWTTEPARFCRSGDLLICVRGSSTGRTNVADDVYCIGRGVAAIRAKSDNDTAYLSYQVVSTVGDILAATTGSTFPSIDGASLRAITIPLPPTKAEQEAIAEALSDADALIESLEQLIAKKRCLIQGAMQELLTGKKRLPGFSQEWRLRPLDEIAIANWGNTATTKTAYHDDGFQAYSASGPDGFVDWYEHELPAVVISAIGAQCGKTWLAKGEWTAIKNTIWFRAKEGESDTSFLYWITGNPSFWPNRGQAQPFIALGDVRRAMVPLPPVTEQTAIAAILSDMDADIVALETKLAKAQQVKQGMMQELLTGRIRLI